MLAEGGEGGEGGRGAGRGDGLGDVRDGKGVHRYAWDRWGIYSLHDQCGRVMCGRMMKRTGDRMLVLTEHVQFGYERTGFLGGMTTLEGGQGQ